MRAADDVEGGAVGVRAEDVAAQPEAGGGEREHAAELAAAENADRRAGRQRLSGHRRPAGSATASVCAPAPGVEPLGQAVVGQRQDGGGEQRRR